MKRVIITIAILTWLAGIVKCDDRLAEALAKTGAALSANAKIDQAEEVLYRALAYNDRCASAYFELAVIAEKRGDRGTACDLYVLADEFSVDQRLKSECVRHIGKLSPAPIRLKMVIAEYATALDKLEPTAGPVASADLEQRRIALHLPKKPPASVSAAPFTPVGKWIKNEEDGCVLNFTDDKRVVMQGVLAKWSVKDSVVIVEWSKFWGTSKFSIKSGDLMTESNGNRLARVKESKE